MPARRVRLPPRAGVQLPSRSRRHLRFSVADPKIRPAHGGHGVRPDPAPERGGALLRAHQGRGRQFRASRRRAREDLLRQPDASLPAGADQAGGAGEPVLPGARHHLPDRQGPARTDRRPSPHGQDDAAPVARELDFDESSGDHAHRAADRRASRGSHRHAADRQGRGASRPRSTSPRSGTSRSPKWSSKRPSASSSTSGTS